MTPISFTDSIKILRAESAKLVPKTESIAVRQALNRVLAIAVSAKVANPSSARAAMDGIAIRFNDLAEIPAVLPSEKWIRINTGEGLPSGFDVVVKIEDVVWQDDQAVIQKPVSYYQNIRIGGEDFPADRLLFSSGHQLHAQDLSLLLAGGYEEIEVYSRPRVSFIPTGSEFLTHASLSDFVESNSAMISALVDSWGGVLQVRSPAPDELDALKGALQEACAESEITILSAGTSMGIHDLSSQAVAALGEVLFHGVAMSPAKPVLLGKIGDLPVLGLPGYPVSAYLGALLFLRPLVCALSGVVSNIAQNVYTSAEDLPARDEDHFYRVQLFEVEGQTYAMKISKGAGSISSLSEMDGLMHVPPATAIRKRDAVRVDMIRDRSKTSLVVLGAVDPDLFQLFDRFREVFPPWRIVFREQPDELALQNIIERTSHMAVIRTVEQGRDLFPAFERQLQEIIHRYRISSRKLGLFVRQGSRDRITALPRTTRIAIAEKDRDLWLLILERAALDEKWFGVQFTTANYFALTDALARGVWDAALIDMRYCNENPVAEIVEHLDLVIPENIMEIPAITRLLELVSS